MRGHLSCCSRSFSLSCLALGGASACAARRWHPRSPAAYRRTPWQSSEHRRRAAASRTASSSSRHAACCCWTAAAPTSRVTFTGARSACMYCVNTRAGSSAVIRSPAHSLGNGLGCLHLCLQLFMCTLSDRKRRYSRAAVMRWRARIFSTWSSF